MKDKEDDTGKFYRPITALNTERTMLWFSEHVSSNQKGLVKLQ